MSLCFKCGDLDMKGDDLKPGVTKFACRCDSGLSFDDTQLELFQLALGMWNLSTGEDQVT